jgi:putative ABC transport system permease protein
MIQLRYTLQALFSHYWRHPWQALFLLSGLIAGVALWSAVQVINGHARASYSEADSLLGAQMTYTIRSDEEGIRHEDYIALRRQGWSQLYPVIEGRVQALSGQLIPVVATDLFVLPGNQSLGQMDVGGSDSNWLGFIQPPYQSWYPAGVAEALNIKVGDYLLLKQSGVLPPAVITESDDQGWQVLMDIGAAQKLLNTDRFNYLGVSELSDEQVEKLRQQLPKYLSLEKNDQALDLEQLTESLHTNLTAMSLLSFAVGLFIVFNAVRFSLWHRQLTLRNLQLMGVDLKTLAIALFMESLFWSVVATALGLLIGYLISLQLLPTLGATLDGLYGATIGAELLLSWGTLLLAWLMTLLGLLLALSWPMWQLSQEAVLPGSQLGTQWQNDVIARKRLLLSGLVLAAVALLIYPLINSVFWGFVLLGLILFAAAWCLPAVLALGLSLLTSFLSKRPQSITNWLLSDGWAQLPSMRTAMMALLLALTCNLGVESLIGSFRTAFTSWLEQRLTADIYVRQHSQALTKLVNEGLEAEWISASHERFEISLRWNQRPTQVRGLDIDAPDTLTLPLAKAVPEAINGWSVSSDVNPQALKAPLILANEQAHYLGGINLNDIVSLETAVGIQKFEVAGFFYDYGNASYQFYLPKNTFSQYWPSTKQRGIALWLNAEASVAKQAVLAEAETALIEVGVSPGDWVTQGRLREIALGVFDKTFAITLAMNALTLIVAGLALLTSMMAILQERLPQFAQWSALGVNSREQILVITVPLLLFVSITWLLSIPLGALLSWLLINKLNIMSFGWSMPMLWSFEPPMVLAALSLGLVLLAVFIAMWRLKRRLPKALAELGSGV